MADRNRPLRPRGGAPGGKRRRRVVMDSQATRPRPDAPGRNAAPPPARARTADPAPKPASTAAPAPPATGPVTVASGATVKDVSAAIGKTVPEIMKFLMGAGEMVSVTQSLSDDAIELIAAEFDREV